MVDSDVLGPEETSVLSSGSQTLHLLQTRLPGLPLVVVFTSNHDSVTTQGESNSASRDIIMILFSLKGISPRVKL